MRKVCLKCGAESDVEVSPAAACEKCGAIFAKVEEAAAKQREAEQIAEAKRRAAALALAQRQKDEADRASELLAQQDESATTDRSWFVTIVFVISLLMAAYGFLEFVLMMDAAKSAPQQAVACAVGIAYAVIPYCFARGIQFAIRGR